MMSERSSMRMQSTSCCFSSGSEVAPPTSFSLGCDMAVSLPLHLIAHHRTPQLPGAHARALVDGVGEPGLLGIERGDGRAFAERDGPVLDARVDLRIHRAEYGGLERCPAGHAAVCAHQHDVMAAHDVAQR